MRLARQTREQFVAELSRWLPQLVATVRERLASMVDTPGQQDQRLAAETRVAFESHRDAWERQVRAALEKKLTQPPRPKSAAAQDMTAFSLLDDEVVENKIIASRLSLAVIDKSGPELNDLTARIQFLEQSDELSPKDVLQPECLSGILIEQWRACELTRPMWNMVHETVRAALALATAQAYQNANAFLVDNGVMPQIDLKARVRRTPAGSRPAGSADNRFGASGPSSVETDAQTPSQLGDWPAEAAFDMSRVHPSDLLRVAEETRMLTNAAPIVRARARAQGVLGKLRRLLSDRVTDFSHTQPIDPSPRLAQALAAR